MNISSTIGLSTVVDAHPRFMCEFILWTLCANKHSDLPKRVYFIGCQPEYLIEFASSNGVDVKFAESLISESPHCNKLIPFLDMEGFEDQIVTDSDLFLTGDISRFFLADAIRLAPNNHAVPSLSIFEQVFAAANVARPPEPGTALFKGGVTRETYAGNVSAGVIFIPASERAMAAAWLENARWLTQNKSLLGKSAGHVDQVSFALTLAKCERPFRYLPAQTNAILQLLPEIQTVYGLHLTSGHIPQYPHWFNHDRTLAWEKINPGLGSLGEQFNATVLEALQIMNAMPETASFSHNFLNPAYDRRKDG